MTSQILLLQKDEQISPQPLLYSSFLISPEALMENFEQEVGLVKIKSQTKFHANGPNQPKGPRKEEERQALPF